MSDVIKFKCKSCEKKIAVRADYAGKKAKCPGCKKPLRVPSPRPKRSATGVPVAVGGGDAAEVSGGLDSNISLAELAAMEESADAELKELSSGATTQPAAMRIEGGKDCPGCGASSKQESVICVYCGHSFESGKKLKTKKDSKLGSAARSVTSGRGDQQDSRRNNIWKYAVPTLLFFIMAMACYTGLVGMIADSIPIEDLKQTYDSIGAASAGTFFLVLCAISGGIWFLMKRVLRR